MTTTKIATFQHNPRLGRSWRVLERGYFGSS